MHYKRGYAGVSAPRSQNCRSWITLLTVIVSASLAVAEPAEKTLFKIEAQPAKTSLTLYARQAEVQLGFAADVVEDILTNRLKGEYANEEALDLLLKGTGLEALYGERGIIIRRIPKRVVATGIDEPVSNLTEGGGLQLTPKATSEAVEPSVAGSRNTDEDEGEREVERLEEILVTGSRIRGARSASPIVTITRQDIDLAGFATVGELVDKLPQNFGAGASLDTRRDSTLNTGNVVGGVVDDLAGGTSVNLRGLGASSTLVLLNGRRMSPSGRSARFTNISSIPVTAIERVEVLTDGASAIYGSDAIGGVVNFILRQDYEGAETRLRYGSDGRGDTANILLGQSFGRSWETGNLLLTYEYYDSDNLANEDRAITASNDLSRFGGTDWRTPGGNPANILAGGTRFAIPAGQDGTALTPADFDSGAPLNLYNERSVGDILPALERQSAFLLLTQELGPFELFAEAKYANEETRSRSNRALDFTVPESNAFFVDPTGTALNEVTVENYSFEDDLPGIGFGEIATVGAVLGMRFDFTENWNGELMANWTEEKAASGNDLDVDLEALQTALGESDPDQAFNPFADGPANSAVLEMLKVRGRRIGSQSRNDLRSIGFNMDGELLDLPGGAVQLASGVEYREDSLLSESIIPQPAISDISRDVLAVYTEFFFPLVGRANSRKWIQRLELSVAGRYESYSDFGSSTNPKVGVAWMPTQALTLRGTYGTSFRAPALFDLDVSNLQANRALYLGEALVDLGVIPFAFIARLGGNEDLQAEEATTWTAGFEWSPEALSGLSFDTTYFSVDFENRIDLPTNNFFTAIADPRFSTILNTNPTPELIAEIVNDPRWADTSFGLTVPTEEILAGVAPVDAIVDLRINNLSRSVVTGVDLQISYDLDTLIGQVNLGLNGSYLFDFERAFIQGDPLIDEVDTYGRPVDFRARGNMTWGRRGWTVSGFVNYTDSYTDNVSDPARPVASWTTADLTLSYDTGEVGSHRVLSNTRLSMTVRNLFDKSPPFVNTLGGVAYDSVNGSPVGRFLAFQMSKDW